MLDVEIIAIGSLKYSPWKLASSDYLKRLKPYCRLKITELSAQSFSKQQLAQAKKQEAEQILKYLQQMNKMASIFLLSQEGQQLTSEKLAIWLQQFDGQSLILVIGGALGFSSELNNKFPKLALSSLTFPHELARTILLEQIYRAICLERGKTYHY